MTNDDDSDFTGLIRGVKRLHSDRVNVYQQRSRKKIKARQIEPEKEPGHVAELAAARDSHFNSGIQKKLQRKIRRGMIRPEASLDLHGYHQNQALEALESFLSSVLHSGMRMVIIIHGQGYRSQSDAVLKPLVQRWLASQPQVLAWCPAQPRDGAAGASYVYLRSND